MRDGTATVKKQMNVNESTKPLTHCLRNCSKAPSSIVKKTTVTDRTHHTHDYIIVAAIAHTQ